MRNINCHKSAEVVDKLIETSSNVMEHVNNTIGTFIPCISVISSLTKEIADAYENAQYNKKTCEALVTRIKILEELIINKIDKEENIEKFLSQGYGKSLDKYVKCLKKIRDFCNDITQLSKFKKFYTSGSIKQKFHEIIEDFDNCSKDLNLAISITTNEEMNEYFSILHIDMIEMMKFLDNIEGGITTIDNRTKEFISNTNEIQILNQEIIFKINNIERQNYRIIEQNNKILEFKDKSKSLDFTPLSDEINKICLLNEQVNNNSNFTLETNRIKPSELNDASQHVVRKDSIQKKVYRSMDVACKPLSMNNIQKHLAILEKLNICPYIIQFYGLSEILKNNVMVFEWAEHGNLREIYLNNNIRWDAKISIARDICRGLAFLHSVNILHHDLKCENILITENMQPKISNFSLAREFNAMTLPNDNVFDIIHWMAPEKLVCIQHPERQEDINRYTIQCEIFSYGMLLWELAFQKKPYENKSLTGIFEHVLSGGRETLDIESDSNSIKEEYCAIIKLAWAHEPSLRPGIQQLFNLLQKLYEKHNIFPLVHPIQNQEKSQNIVQAVMPPMATIQQICVTFLFSFLLHFFLFRL